MLTAHREPPELSVVPKAEKAEFSPKLAAMELFQVTEDL